MDKRPEPTVTLTGPQLKSLSDAMKQAFDVPGLEELLLYRLDRQLNTIAAPGDNLSDAIRKVIGAANREGWMADLLHAVAEERPALPDLQSLVNVLLAAPAAAPDSPTKINPAYPPCPFGDTGRITDPSRFHDREELLRRIFEELDKHASLSLVGETQVGKSSILSMICQFGPQRVTRRVDRFAILDLELVENEGDFYEALCYELGVPETLRGGKLERALRGRHIVLCLDEMEKMTWDGFSIGLRSYLRGLTDGTDRPLTLVTASRMPLATLFPDAPNMTSPLAGSCHPLDVKPFSASEARRFLTDRLAGTGVSFLPAEADDLLQQTGGHPARLQRAAADLYRRLASNGC